jgi:hypothetical protein
MVAAKRLAAKAVSHRAAAGGGGMQIFVNMLTGNIETTPVLSYKTITLEVEAAKRSGTSRR